MSAEPLPEYFSRFFPLPGADFYSIFGISELFCGFFGRNKRLPLVLKFVEELAAISPPTISPINPTGRNLSMAGKAISCPRRLEFRWGKAFWVSDNGGYTIKEHSATRSHGQGRST
jgi:hypothetical protein